MDWKIDCKCIFCSLFKICLQQLEGEANIIVWPWSQNTLATPLFTKLYIIALRIQNTIYFGYLPTKFRQLQRVKGVCRRVVFARFGSRFHQQIEEDSFWTKFKNDHKFFRCYHLYKIVIFCRSFAESLKLKKLSPILK